MRAVTRRDVIGACIVVMGLAAWLHWRVLRRVEALEAVNLRLAVEEVQAGMAATTARDTPNVWPYAIDFDDGPTPMRCEWALPGGRCAGVSFFQGDESMGAWCCVRMDR